MSDTQITVRWKHLDDEAWFESFLSTHWGGTTMIVRGSSLQLLRLPTLVAGNRDGIAIFTTAEPAELVLIHAVQPQRGIGGALLKEVVDYLRAIGTTQLLVTTTNDNVNALRFYQRHGFRICGIRSGAVDVARRLKPTIPLVSHDGIPIHDELDLSLDLGIGQSVLFRSTSDERSDATP